MKWFEIRMRRVVIEIYSVYAKNEQHAREKAENWDDIGAPMEVDQEDFEVLSVKEDK